MRGVRHGQGTSRTRSATSTKRAPRVGHPVNTWRSMQSNQTHLAEDALLLHARLELGLAFVTRGLHTVVCPAMLDLESVARVCLH